MNDEFEIIACSVILVCAVLMFLGFFFMMICSGIADLRNSKKKEKENV